MSKMNLKESGFVYTTFRHFMKTNERIEKFVIINTYVEMH